MTVAETIGTAPPQSAERDVSVAEFVHENSDYYSDVFERFQRGSLSRLHFNLPGLLIPWLWSASRGLWLMFWLSLALDMIGLVCLLQIVKYSPLLAEAQLDPSANATLIERYSRWITTFGWTGAVVLIGGRLLVGNYANR